MANAQKRYQNMAMMDINNMIVIIDAIGAFVFAISGIRMAANKGFDLFGAFVVGFATAIGGGTLRDLLLGVTPVWMTNSIYVSMTILALVFVVVFRKRLIHMNVTFFIFDTFGLALYTVVGIEKTLAYDFPWWVPIAMGTMGGAAGGIIRDVLLAEVPLIFKKEIYATACILGGVIFFICDSLGANQLVSGFVCAGVVVVSRVLAVRYGISIPKLKKED